MRWAWRVEERTVKVRPGATLSDLFDGDIPDRGHRYRYRCSCGHVGPWRRDPNMADGDEHLYRVHGEGE
jgi:hypothetical protein